MLYIKDFLTFESEEKLVRTSYKIRTKLGQNCDFRTKMGQKCYKKLLIFDLIIFDKGRHFSTKHSNSSSAKICEKMVSGVKKLIYKAKNF